MHHWSLAVADHRHVEVLHHLFGHRVRCTFPNMSSLIVKNLILTYHNLVDTAVGEDREGPLVQVHDGVVGPLVPELVANGPFCHLLTTGSVCSPTIR